MPGVRVLITYRPLLSVWVLLTTESVEESRTSTFQLTSAVSLAALYKRLWLLSCQTRPRIVDTGPTLTTTLPLLLVLLAAGSLPPDTFAVLVNDADSGSAGNATVPRLPLTTRGTTAILIGCMVPGLGMLRAAGAAAELVQVTVTPPPVALPLVCAPVWVQVQPVPVIEVTSRPPGRVSTTVTTPLEAWVPMFFTCSVNSPVPLTTMPPVAGELTVLATVRSTPATVEVDTVYQAWLVSTYWLTAQPTTPPSQ